MVHEILKVFSILISKVFYPGQPKPVFFVANRGHHADIGGITPGRSSMNNS